MDQPTHEHNDMSVCAQVRAYVMEYMDGELDAAVAAAITVHTRRCHECGARLHFEAAFLDAVARCDTATLPAPLHDRLRQILELWRSSGAAEA